MVCEIVIQICMVGVLFSIVTNEKQMGERFKRKRAAIYCRLQGGSEREGADGLG